MLKEKIKYAPRNPESAISGEGYGASHKWKYLETTAGRCSLYKCADCGRNFSHHYPSTPDIHEAIFKYTGGGSQVPDVCSGAATNK